MLDAPIRFDSQALGGRVSHSHGGTAFLFPSPEDSDSSHLHASLNASVYPTTFESNRTSFDAELQRWPHSRVNPQKKGTPAGHVEFGVLPASPAGGLLRVRILSAPRKYSNAGAAHTPVTAIPGVVLDFLLPLDVASFLSFVSNANDISLTDTHSSSFWLEAPPR